MLLQVQGLEVLDSFNSLVGNCISTGGSAEDLALLPVAKLDRMEED